MILYMRLSFSVLFSWFSLVFWYYIISDVTPTKKLEALQIAGSTSLSLLSPISLVYCKNYTPVQQHTFETV